MNLRITIALLLIGGAVCRPAQAQLNISSLNTGAGQDGINYISAANHDPNVLTDPNWTVTWLSNAPPVGIIPYTGGEPATGGPGPGGIPSGTAYLVPWDINPGGVPLASGNWLGSDGISDWLTYADPQAGATPGWFTGEDITGDTYDYEVSFTAANSGMVTVNWLSDNESYLYLNGALVGASPTVAEYKVWSTVTLSLAGGTAYVLDLDIVNDPQWDENPTGGRVEFSGDVTIVPEPTSAALVCLGLGGLLVFRRHRR